jgi:hypothetical protein
MAAKRRPTFSPGPTKTGPASTHTDWVYRSDQPAAKATPAAKAAPAAKATPAAKAAPVAKAAPAAKRASASPPKTAPPKPKAPPTPQPPARPGYAGVGTAAGLLAPIALVHLFVVAPLMDCMRRCMARS